MNESLYQDEHNNAIRISSLKKFEGDLPFVGFAVKFVLTGHELYQIRGKRYKVEKGKYIVGNSGTIASIEINSMEDTKGLCVDISEQIIAEVAEYHFTQAQHLKDFLLGEQFLVNTYHAKNTNLGYALQEISRQVATGHHGHELLNAELFYSISESIVKDQQIICEQYSKLHFKKTETRQTLLRQLLEAREFMDAHIQEDIHLDQIIQNAFMSKYQFIRLFKATFSLSPYQYILRKRLECARLKLLAGNTVTETAYDSGYPDAASFCKAFKSAFGITPSSVRLK
jgi:AraC-like DNA-binding protein